MRAVGSSGVSLLDYIDGGTGSNTDLLSALNKAKQNNPNKTGDVSKPNKVLSEQIKKANAVCDATKDAAIGLREHAEKLSETEKDSLFEKAEKSGSTKEVASEISSFIDDYNKMVENMKKSDGSVNTAYCKRLAEDFEEHKEELAEIGITLGKNGTLLVDIEKLEAASLDSLKKVFSGSSSFAGKTASKSIYIEAQAVSTKSKNQANAQTGNYNPYGGTGSAALDEFLGNYFNSAK